MMRLQWGRDVSIPEMRSIAVIKAVKCSASMGPGCFYPGNLGLADWQAEKLLASMGPGCFYPGNGLPPNEKLALIVLQWGRDVSIPEMRRGACPAARLPCFNGAGMFLSRKCGASLSSSSGLGRLQWGRDVSIPEICCWSSVSPEAATLQWGRDVSIPEIQTPNRCHPCYRASMGPGCFYPGNGAAAWASGTTFEASMGPGCFYPGNFFLPGQNLLEIEASMGPGCFYPGNPQNGRAATSRSWLQWGRDVSIPEMLRWALGGATFPCASMGPGCFYPGNDISWALPLVPEAASMGPGCFYPGNPVSIVPVDQQLQGFNGAGMFLSRKFSCPSWAERRFRSFNGAGMFLSRKSHRAHTLCAAPAASMGPGCFYPGNIGTAMGSTIRNCFNGAGMFLSRKWAR